MWGIRMRSVAFSNEKNGAQYRWSVLNAAITSSRITNGADLIFFMSSHDQIRDDYSKTDKFGEPPTHHRIVLLELLGKVDVNVLYCHDLVGYLLGGTPCLLQGEI